MRQILCLLLLSLVSYNSCFAQSSNDEILLSILTEVSNERLPERLYFLTGHKLEEDLDLEVELLRNGDINVTGAFSEDGLSADLKMVMPSNLRVRLDWKEDFGLFEIKHHEDIKGDLDIILETFLEFSNDALTSNSTVSYKWTSAPNIDKVTLEEADNYLMEMLAKETENINQRVNSVLKQILSPN